MTKSGSITIERSDYQNAIVKWEDIKTTHLQGALQIGKLFHMDT